jgi:hypothetical protein
MVAIRTLPIRSAPSSPAPFAVPARGEWAQSLNGKKSDPINLYLHGSLEQVKAAFLKAGWVLPRSNTTRHQLEYAGASVFQKTVGKLWSPGFIDRTVASMPIAHLKYQGKPDVLSFERDNDPTGGRHHFRVFDTGRRDARGRQVWAVAASLDDDTVFAPKRPEQLFITHTVEPNADVERDEVLRSLSRTKGVAAMKTHQRQFGAPAPNGLHSPDGRVFEVWVP